MTMTIQADASSAANVDLVNKTVCLILSRGKFGNRRKVSHDQYNVDADKHFLTLTKRLLKSDTLKQINALHAEARDYLREIAIPMPVLRGGAYLVPIPMVEAAVDKLDQFAALIAGLVERACLELPTQIAAMKEPLGDLFNEADYPTVEQFRAMFYFTWEFTTFGTVPGSLKHISQSIFEQEREKAAARMQTVATDAQQILRAFMLGLVGKLSEKLQPEPDGKKKKLHKSTVEKLQGFLATFDIRNVTNDQELGKLVAQTRGLMAGLDVETLKQDEAVRGAMATQLAKIEAELKTITVDAHTRKIELDEED